MFVCLLGSGFPGSTIRLCLINPPCAHRVLAKSLALLEGHLAPLPPQRYRMLRFLVASMRPSLWQVLATGFYAKCCCKAGTK